MIPIKIIHEPPQWAAFGEDALNIARQSTLEEIEATIRSLDDSAALHRERFAADRRLFLKVTLFVTVALVGVLMFSVLNRQAFTTTAMFTGAIAALCYAYLDDRARQFESTLWRHLELHRHAAAIRQQLDEFSLAASSVEES